MNPLARVMGQMPPAVRMVAMIGTVGVLGVLGLLLLTLGGAFGRNLILFLVLAAAVLALLFAGVMYLRKRRKQKQEKHAGEAIAESATGQSSAVSEPDEIARLDQLRKDWQKAYQTYCEFNDDGSLARLPWILIAGEPGSGKTEAIRHSGIPFPSGLNKPHQGSGGTYNMDWWFANDAILIDTAGRLMFNETPEWNELLKQLNRARPHCPINGMVLVIPTDSLLTDSTEEIEQKADRIAQQINTIRRELGIRFPVFVVITKCDYITGFREYFSSVDDPALQHQILGWSNPDEIDEPFQPEMVDEHLEFVSGRLRARAMTMLLDPPQVDEYSDRRADQVDALFAFPQELLRIQSRLRLYMEKIFTPGPWTKKPPFVRGIYFTSSMQEGREIDTALAELLGVSNDELPAGRAWQKDKAYFLKDLFLQKVFAEQGLVTRAVNAAQQYRRNRLLVNSVSIAVLVLSAIWIVWGALSLRDSIGQQYNHWAGVAGAAQVGDIPPYLAWEDDAWVVNDQQIRFRGAERRELRADSIPHLLEQSSNFAAEAADISPRGLLRPVSWFVRSRVNQDDVLEAHRLLVQHTVLGPLLRATRDQLARDAERGAWRVEVNSGGRAVSTATRALGELIRLEAIQAGRASLKDFDVEALIEYVSADNESFSSRDIELITLALGVIEDGRHARDFMADLNAGGEGTQNYQIVTDALRSYEQYWNLQLAERAGEVFEPFNALVAAASAFDEREGRLLRLRRESDISHQEWESHFGSLQQAKEQLTKSLASMESDTIRSGFLHTARDARQSCETGYAHLRAAAGFVKPADSGEDANGSTSGARLGLFADTLDRGQRCPEPHMDADERQRWGELDTTLLAFLDDTGVRTFEHRYRAYDSANAVFSAEETGEFEVGMLQDVVAGLDRQRGASELIEAPEGVDEALEQRHLRGRELVSNAVQRASEYRLNVLLEQALRAYAEMDIGQQVAELAERRHIPAVPLSIVAMRDGDDDAIFNTQYDYEIARQVFRDWLTIQDRLNDEDAGSGYAEYWHDARNNFEQYVADYTQYWRRDVCEYVHVADFAEWSEFREEILHLGARPRHVVPALDEIAEIRKEALKKLAIVDDEVSWASTVKAADFETDYEHFREQIAGDLDRDADRAVMSFASMSRTDLERYVIVHDMGSGDVPCIVRDYFRTLQLRTVSILARHAEAPRQQAIADLRNPGLRRFPLQWNPDDDSALTASQMRQAKDAVDVLFQYRDDARSGDDVFGVPELDEQLRRLRGEDDALPDRQRQTLDAIRQIAASFGGERIEVELIQWGNGATPPNGAVADASPAEDIFQLFQIRQDGDPVIARQLVDPRTVEPINVRMHPREPLQWMFGTRDAEWTEIGDGTPWSLLALLQRGGVPDESSGSLEAGYHTWHLPVKGTHTGRDVVFWLKVKFQMLLPAPEQWPGNAPWPRF